jgi:hypothetical protein
MVNTDRQGKLVLRSKLSVGDESEHTSLHICVAALTLTLVSVYCDVC